MGKKIFFVLLLTIVGCAQTPTRVYTREEYDVQALKDAVRKPIRITSNTVILDARPPFEFAVAHLSQSSNVLWTDFADVRGPFPGRLKKDLSDDIRRLSLLGIGPTTPVVVVGQGHQGQGEEGRLAWTLLYLGLKNVQVAELGSLGLRYSNVVLPPRENSERWSPDYKNSILAEKDEVIQAATSKHDGRVHILDVRSKNEYFSKDESLQYVVPDLRALHVEWKEFFTLQGRPDREIRQKLQAIHVGVEDRVIVISNNGVRSAAVTYALLTLGYKKAANFSGGYTELLAHRRSRR